MVAGVAGSFRGEDSCVESEIEAMNGLIIPHVLSMHITTEILPLIRISLSWLPLPPGHLPLIQDLWRVVIHGPLALGQVSIKFDEKLVWNVNVQPL